MPDFRVAHHAGGQTDARARRGEQRARIFLKYLIVKRSLGERDRVAFTNRRVTESVNHHERQRLSFLHNNNLLVCDFNRKEVLEEVQQLKSDECEG